MSEQSLKGVTWPVGYAGVRTDGRCPHRPSEWCPWRPNAEDEHLLRLIARGLSNRQIGLEMGLSAHTVSHRITVLSNKLGVQARDRDGAGTREVRVRLAVWASERGLTERPGG